MIKLVGIVVVALGFAFRLNALLVVVAAGIATGLAAGMTFNEIVAQFGAFFVENRYMTLPVVLMLPLIGMLEYHGLQQRAQQLIGRVRAATAGRVLLLYCAVRQLSISVGVRIGEHASMVRPLVAPMAEAAAAVQVRRRTPAPGEADDAATTLPPELVHAIRAHAAAAENVGNFFGEDIFVAVGAVLLMNGFFQAVHVEVSIWALALWGIPTAVAALAIMAWRLRRLDRRIRAHAAERAGQREDVR